VPTTPAATVRATGRAAVPADRRRTTNRRRRVLLTGPNPRLVLAEHERQDRQLLDLLSRSA